MAKSNVRFRLAGRPRPSRERLIAAKVASSSKPEFLEFGYIGAEAGSGGVLHIRAHSVVSYDANRVWVIHGKHERFGSLTIYCETDSWQGYVQ